MVAELGVNHDGEVGRAVELVSAAADAGADAVKLQCFRPERLLAETAELAGYQRRSESDAAAMLGRLTLSVDELAAVRDAARSRGLSFVATPFSLDDVADVAGLGVDAVKVASPDVVNLPLLEAAAGLGVAMLVSTGAASLEEVAAAAVVMHRHAEPTALLQCVSAYPAAEADASLGGIAVLAEQYRLPTGYSDHTASVATGAVAVAAGACVIEKHLTYNCSAAGPDHAASLEPAAFGDYVRRVREAAAMMGPRAKRVLPCEEEVRRLCRQSLYATRDVSAGETIARGDVAIRRPASGLPAAALSEVVGKPAQRDLVAGQAIAHDAVRWA